MKDTNLLLQISPLPVEFVGTPQEFLYALVHRAKIVSPSGTNFFFSGDVEPVSNVGPWLKNDTQWWVWDDEIKRYKPLDISESETKWFWRQNSVPPTSTPPVWLKTTKDQTETDTSGGNPIGWYEFNGTAWVPFTGVVNSGTTAQRPASPQDFQQYYDTDIVCLIWWERGKWRTVSGVPGDLKPVSFETLVEALLFNPGWDVFGAANAGFRGRYVSEATKDAFGSGGTTDLTVSPGVAKRGAFETFGETDGVQLNSSSPVPYPPTIALWWLVKE